MMLAWLTMTPLGAPVEPDVYCRKTRLSGPTGGFVHGGDWAGSSSLSSHGTWPSAPPRACKAASWPAIPAVVSARAGPASSAINCKRGRVRAFVGGSDGTATTPAYMQA